MMDKLRLWVAQMRYPTPELGDFVEDIPLDKLVADDHNDQDAANKEKKPRGGKK